MTTWYRLCVLFCLCLPSFAQGGRVDLAVVVTDKSGKPVKGLTQEDFTLLDNKKPQKILSFQAVEGATAGHPVETVLLVDRANEQFTTVGVELEQLKRFLRSNGGKLQQPTSMMFLDDAGAHPESATLDGNVLIQAIEKRDSGLRTVTRTQQFQAQQRFQMSIEALMSVADFEKKKPGRKMLIWFGPGWPLLNGPNMRLTAHEEKGLFDSAVTVSNALREAQITVYSLEALGDFYKYFRKGVPSAHGILPGNLVLQVLAEQTGGEVMRMGDDVGTKIANCLVDSSAWYAISFEYPPPDGPVEYHSLEVKMGQKGLTARTRTGYYAKPQGEAP
jgi:VWFA-related protein